MDASRTQAATPTADLLALGVTPKELRGPRWRSPFRGLHTPALPVVETADQRLADAVELVPRGGAFGGWAAGWLLGATDLDGRGRSGRERQDLVIVVPPEHHPAHRPGIRFVRCRLSDDDITERGGIAVTSPIRTTFDLARGSTVEEGLVAADAITRQLRLPPAAVMEYAARHPRMRGIPIARTVLRLADPSSRSTGETRLRYIWVVDAGLPRPRCNAYVLDEQGTVVAMPDLLDEASGLAAEYDGSTHRSLADHTYDNAREEDLEQLGLVVVRATSLDIGPYRTRTVARLLAGRRRASAASSRSWGWRPGPR